MSDPRIRTAVLACEGEARDRIVEGLAGAGADVVGVIAPAIADPQHVRELDPGAIVVALEPAIEDALERYAGVLSDPAIIVIFEEASVVLGRTGWDAARWVRHLAAKLRRDVDVLPPSLHGFDDDAAEDDADASMSPVLAFDLDEISAAGADDADAALSPYAFDPVSFEHDESGVAPTIELDPELGAGLSLLEDIEDETSGDLLQVRASEAPTLDLEAAIAAWSVEQPADEVEGRVEDNATARTAGHETVVDLASDGVQHDVLSSDVLSSDVLSFDETDEADSAVTAQRGADADSQGEPAVSTTLSLVDDDAAALPSFAAAGPAVAAPGTAPNPGLHRDLDALASRISGLSLSDTDSYGHGPEHGAVLVEGGLGGPDAVRQLLADIPEGFPRPILVRLHLDGGRYDRLVRQMERATVLPVSLAEAGNEIADGEIHFVSPDLDIIRSGGRLRFATAAGASRLPDALPAEDSAVLFLSGSDASLVDEAMGPAWQGALVAGQSPEGCYDPAAAQAAIARGSASGTPAELAGILVARWMPENAPAAINGGLSL